MGRKETEKDRNISRLLCMSKKRECVWFLKIFVSTENKQKKSNNDIHDLKTCSISAVHLNSICAFNVFENQAHECFKRHSKHFHI